MTYFGLTGYQISAYFLPELTNDVLTVWKDFPSGVVLRKQVLSHLIAPLVPVEIKIGVGIDQKKYNFWSKIKNLKNLKINKIYRIDTRNYENCVTYKLQCNWYKFYTW